MGVTLETIKKNNQHSNKEEEVSNNIRDYFHQPTIPNQKIHLTNPTDIKNIINGFQNNIAPGEDKIDNKLLKNLPRKTIVQLMCIVKGILKTGYYPSSWKTAVVIPIPNPGKDLSNPINYRPISLLSSLSKVAETIILKRIQDYDNKEKIMAEEQSGFRRGHNSSLQVARIVNAIMTHFNKNNVTAMTLIDIEKAFDTVWVDGIVHKLVRDKFPRYLIEVIKNYLREGNSE